MNYCNCPNCQTADCPAGVEIADLRREIVQLQLELNAKVIKPEVFRFPLGWGNPKTLIEQNPPKGVLSNATPQAQQPTKQQTNL
jgi:hypothetical protein